MIIFKRIKWKNFLSTGNLFTELNLNANKTTLIVGENGAGKSTMLDALFFVLFNKPFRNINKPQLLNTITKRDLLVEVEFQIGKHEYKIVRGMKPEIFEIYKDGNLQSQNAKSKDYQSILETQILKLNHKTSRQVIVLGSASFVPFMQLPAQARREIIEDLLDLQIFTSMNVLLKEKVTNNTERINATSSDKRVAQAQLDLLKKHLEEVNVNNEKQIEEKQSKIDSTVALITNASEERKQLIKKLEDIQTKLGDQEEVRVKLEKLERYDIQLKGKLTNARRSVDFYNDHDNCPTCSQGIAHVFKAETIAEKTKQIEEVEQGIEKIKKERAKQVERLEEFSKLNKEYYDTNLECSQIRTRIDNWKENIINWKEEISYIKTDKEQVNMTKVEELETQLKQLGDQFNELHDEKTVLAAAASILKDGGIKAKIIKQYIPIINKFINKYLSAMDFFVNFELNEQFDETIKSRFRDEFSYASFSEGEKMRINLSILFTWRAVSKLRNSISTNLLIMDEVFDSSLDSNGTEEFLKILQSLTVDTNTFIISHKTDQLYDRFEKVIKFEKHKNFSKIAA
jgi:DNA repair exonuclease SbcCD ATPase subunit